MSTYWPALLTAAARATGPIALGHLSAMALVAGSALLGASVRPSGWAALAAAALLTLVGWRCVRRRRPAGRAGVALGSFMLTSLHGAGLALVPALLPLCAGSSPGAAGPLQAITLAAAALAAHTATMLVVSGFLAAAAYRAASALKPRSAARPGS